MLTNSVVCGFYPALDEIKSSVTRTIMAIQRIKEPDKGQLARSLVWPACIAGCLAEKEQETFFRNFIAAGVDSADGFGNCQTTRDVLEACWQHRWRNKTNVTDTIIEAEVWGWSRTMKHMGYDVLLV